MSLYKYFNSYIHNNEKASQKMDQDKVNQIRSSKYQQQLYNFSKI